MSIYQHLSQVFKFNVLVIFALYNTKAVDLEKVMVN